MSLIDSYLSNIGLPSGFSSSTLTLTKERKAKNSILNTFFDKVIVINLKRSLSRLIRVTEQLRTLGIRYEIFNAVDGTLAEVGAQHEAYLEKEVKPEEMHPLEIKRGDKLLKRPGEYAYLLTWALLLRKLIREDRRRVLVFEDDVLLCDNFELRCRNWLTQEVPQNALVWLLGASQLPRLRNPVNYGKNFFRPGLTDGSFALGLDHRVYHSLLEKVEKMNAPFDSGPLRDIYKDPEFRDRSYVAYPHLVIAEVGNSNIRESKDLVKVAEKLEWNLVDFSTYKESGRNLRIALTLYGSLVDLDIEKILRCLLSEPCVSWKILIISKDVIDPAWKDKEYEDCKLYPRTVSNLRLAEEIADQHLSSGSAGSSGSSRSARSLRRKFDKIIFYDLALKLDDNVLHAISSLF